jgi:hypothetical protein
MEALIELTGALLQEGSNVYFIEVKVKLIKVNYIINGSKLEEK